ncbi:MAG: M14 family metallopeptidase [Chloroflexota bacterium]
MEPLFPASYETSRARFLRDVKLIRPCWPSSRLESHPLKDHPDLSVDWLWAEPRAKENLVIVSTGQHGIEGYVGSAMLKLLMDEFAPRLNPENTGLLLVHAINPWGMKHWRKVNENGVDLNRNFVLDDNFDTAINPEFHRVAAFINPQRRLESFEWENILFWGNVVKNIFATGIPTITRAALLGQHHTPNGFYYGGTSYQGGTRVVMELYRRTLEEYQSIIHLDMHSGYGPRRQMSVIMSPLDPQKSEELSQKFNYPLVLKINAEEFYEISGDMAAYYYQLRNELFPGKQLFACGFEFGTFGDSLLARIRSLRAMVFENQLHWQGAASESTAQAIRKEFRELYFPADEAWRAKALVDGRQAFEGLLKSYCLI